MTKEEAQQIAEEIRATGYKGGIRKTEVGGVSYIVRGLTALELQSLSEDLRATEPEARDRAIVNICTYPETDWDHVGFAVQDTLISKIMLLSGAPGENMILAFFQDEVLSNPVTWERPTSEEVDALREKYPGELRLTSFQDAYPVVYRPVMGGQYKAAALQAGEDLEELAKLVLKASIVWPEEIDWNYLPARLQNSMYQKVMMVSGYTEDVDIEDDEVL